MAKVLMKEIAEKGIYFILFLMVFFGFFRMFLYKSLKGTLKGELKFTKDFIVAGEITYKMSDIKKMELYFHDYHGRLETGKSFNPARSVGIENAFFLSLNDGEIRTIHFQIYHKGEFDKMKDLMIEYHLQDKIHFLKLIEYLGITKYEDIQEFKKTLRPVNSN